MLWRSRLLASAGAASALAVQRYAEAKAAPSLRSVHEALSAGPLGRRYAAASPLGNGLWALGFAASDLRTKARSSQVQVVQVDQDGSRTLATLAVDPATVVTRSAEGLELRQSSAEGGKKLALELWLPSGVRLARREVEGVGAKPLPAGVFGKPAFSPSGGKVAWLAERLPAAAEAPSYWAPAPKGERVGKGAAADAGGTAEGGALPGKYSLADARSTGEALLVHGSVLCVWDWKADVLSLVRPEEVLPEGSLTEEGVAVAAHVAFDGTEHGVVFGCHLLPAHFPGISACLNRPTALFHLTDLSPSAPADAAATPTGGRPSGGKAAAATCLTPDLYFAHMPRLSPDCKTLAFAAQPRAFAGHSTVVEVRTMPWPPSHAAAPPTSAVVLPATAKPEGAGGFGGLCGYHDELASLAWLGPSTLAFNTIAGAAKATYSLEVGAAAAPVPLRPPGLGDGSVELLGCADGVALVQCSSLTRPHSVWACRGGAWSCLVDAAQLHREVAAASADAADAAPCASLSDAAESALGALGGARLERLRLPESDGGAEALVLLPAAAPSGQPHPWVLKIHGGPHGTSLDAFNAEAALLLSQGIAVIFPNYRGSLGEGEDFAEALLGQCGTMDVDDCAALTRLALARLPAELDASRGACYGGSHGGFLTAWLLGSQAHKHLYTCGVLWNPVVDLVGMLGATDIPEWVFAEGLGADAPLRWPLSAEQVQRLYARSPISVVDQVAVPSLMLLGAADQRVPPSQGRQWVAAVQNNAKARVTALSFGGEGHAIASLEANAHAVQSAVAWLRERLGTAPEAEGGAR